MPVELRFELVAGGGARFVEQAHDVGDRPLDEGFECGCRVACGALEFLVDGAADELGGLVLCAGGRARGAVVASARARARESAARARVAGDGATGSGVLVA
ncbi:hypothetical protein [Streptomyces sp. NPDC048142]|uniref:hypothetical protein n=1 Tax=Streptomyces sp. NPDC048142 TaxID=3365501 RepID=UPI0037166FA4